MQAWIPDGAAEADASPAPAAELAYCVAFRLAGAPVDPEGRPAPPFLGAWWTPWGLRPAPPRSCLWVLRSGPRRGPGVVLAEIRPALPGPTLLAYLGPEGLHAERLAPGASHPVPLAAEGIPHLRPFLRAATGSRVRSAASRALCLGRTEAAVELELRLPTPRGGAPWTWPFRALLREIRTDAPLPLALRLLLRRARAGGGR